MTRESGRFADATPEMLAQLLAVIDGLDDNHILQLTNWATGQYIFTHGNTPNVTWYANQGREKKLR